MRYIQKRYTKPTKVKSHKRKIGRKTVRVKPYTRKIERVRYGFKKNITNRQYKENISKMRTIPSIQLPSSDADRDSVRNYDDCYPFDRNRQDETLVEIYKGYYIHFEELGWGKEYHIHNKDDKYTFISAKSLNQAKGYIDQINKGLHPSYVGTETGKKLLKNKKLLMLNNYLTEEGRTSERELIKKGFTKDEIAKSLMMGSIFEATRRPERTYQAL